MVRQFDVYPHPQAGRQTVYPYLVVVQHDRIGAVSGEILAVPLGQQIGAGEDRLMPLVELNGERLRLLTPLMRRINARLLRAPIGTLVQDRDRIVAAIDLLFVGS